MSSEVQNAEGMAETQPLDKLPLDGWHRSRGGRMVPFAGYEMPVQYEGIIAEHLWTRESAGLFDVSHMGQLFVHGRAFVQFEPRLAKLVAQRPQGIRVLAIER